MNVNSAQIIAANMTFIVVAILATTLIVIVPAWKRFQTYWAKTPRRLWRSITLASSILVGAPVLLFVAALISVAISTDNWPYELPYVVLLMFLALLLPVYLYILPRWLWTELLYAKAIASRARALRISPSFGSIRIFVYCLNRRLWRWSVSRRDAKPAGRPDVTKEVGALAALGCFVLTVFITLNITSLAVPVAIGVDFGGPAQEENFESARAMMVVAPYSLTCGLACLALSYFGELKARESSATE